MMLTYRHWFWDFDGTLFNTYPRICRAFQKSLADAGIFEDTATIYPVIKRSLEIAAVTYAAAHGITPQTLLDGYHLHSEEEDLSTMRPYPGMKDLLARIRDRGGRNYLYTHRGDSVFKALKHEGMEALFTDMVTSLDGFPAKPAPDALRYLLRKHSLDPADCVMAGDRTIDLEAGLNAGINAVCVDPDGLCPPLPGIPVFRSYAELSAALDQEGP